MAVSHFVKIVSCEIAQRCADRARKADELFTRQKTRGDKFAFLGSAGYTTANFQQLLGDLRNQVLSQEAALLQQTKFGQFYEIRATLTGPNGNILQIRSIWMTEHLSGVTKFITLVPDRTK